MGKRFTETKKWEDPWFQDLDPHLKCVWGYILDHCDNAGVWVVNTKLMGFQIGKTIPWATIKERFGKRLREFSPGKIWVPKFIEFQYGSLSPACKPHLKIIGLLKNHNLFEEYSKGIHTLQEEEEDRDKEEDLDLGGMQGGMVDETPAKTFFDEARIAYPGTKRGLEPEWQGFKKGNPAYENILPLLLPAIEKEIGHKKAQAGSGFVPQWANFSTWINQKRWTQEFGEVINGSNGKNSGGYESAQQRKDRRLREVIGQYSKPAGPDPEVDYQDVRVMP